MAKSRQDFEKEWAKVVAKAWSDARFKERLLRNPAEALKELGIQVPPGIKLEIHAQNSKVVHLILPPKPKEELSESELRKYAAGERCGASEDQEMLGRVFTIMCVKCR